jgi:signal transduction histidine kinase
MKRTLTRLSRRYQLALRKHLRQGSRASLLPARGLGREAAAIGLETLDMARIHEGALAALGEGGNIKRAEVFFVEAITPIEKTHRAALKTDAHLNQLDKTLDRRTAELAAADRELKRGIDQREAAEEALKKSGTHCAWLLEESHHLQEHLRHLAHRTLSAQEAKRAKISRQLHDEIAQTLLGINVRLLTLKTEATISAKGLKKEIASTQHLVEKSVKTMRRFAREIGIQHET